ncbi:transposase [Chromobacterium violaceum]|uniref:transposase n=1 Tax=Chromobacterium violaceum TaxID=536 RepID=UPI003B837C4E
MRCELVTQKLWKSLQSLLLTPPRRHDKVRPRFDERAVWNGILFVPSTGIQWEGLQ